ncbi:MAG: hypothetical protein ACD_58C00297G0009 [uncultured bacterium]|nr:MAG: hypothetical protein ACD_58C00297G0009 [uncultured bacterium]
MLNDISIWDYKISKKDLSDPKVLLWYLERKAQMADWVGLDKKVLVKNLNKLNISPYRKKAIKLYFNNENSN